VWWLKWLKPLWISRIIICVSNYMYIIYIYYIYDSWSPIISDPKKHWPAPHLPTLFPSWNARRIPGSPEGDVWISKGLERINFQNNNDYHYKTYKILLKYNTYHRNEIFQNKSRIKNCDWQMVSFEMHWNCRMPALVCSFACAALHRITFMLGKQSPDGWIGS
jgi:hypothetical protein